MNTGSKLMDNELFYEPEDGFWGGTDKLMFEANNLEAEWPKPTNVFIKRMADPSRMANGIQNLAFADFKQIVGAFIDADPHATYRFLVIPQHRSGMYLSLQLIKIEKGEMPPLRADNSCSLSTAIEWMASRNSHFEISCAAGGTYWVHKK